MYYDQFRTAGELLIYEVRGRTSCEWTLDFEGGVQKTAKGWSAKGGISSSLFRDAYKRWIWGGGSDIFSGRYQLVSILVARISRKVLRAYIRTRVNHWQE